MRLSTLLMATTLAALSSAPQAVSAQFSENFNGGVVPPGWTATNNAGVVNYQGHVIGNNSILTSPTFTLGGAGSISFDAFFRAGDYSFNNDMSYVQIFDGTAWSTLFYADIQQVGDFGSTGGTFTAALAAGTYQLQMSVWDGRASYDGPSELFVDNIAATSAITTPEPASIALVATGLMAVFGATRRRRTTR